MKQLFAVIGCIFLITSCDDPELDCCAGPKGVALSEPFSILEGETVNVESSIINMTFVRLDGDSLCPEDVECITQGTLSITIDINGTKERLSIGDASQSTVAYRNYTIELQALVYPMKEDEKANSNSTYAVQMMITRR